MIPSEYLLPFGVIGSLNKWIIFPLAMHTADYITLKTGILKPEELKGQHEIFQWTF